MSVSEGGFGLVTTEPVEQGDSIRLRIQAQGAVPEAEVEAIVWYDTPAPRGLRSRGLRLLGCVLPDRSPAFLEVFAEVEKRNAPPEPRMRAARVRSARKPSSEDEDLPRSRAPLTPRKPEPEESLPRFSVRLKQIGGPRTRFVSVRACSMVQAAERALSEISGSASGDGDAWTVLEITPRGGDPAEGKA